MSSATKLKPEAARKILERSQADPQWFAREVLGVHVWSKQREILEAVRDNRRVAVRSCHGVGKTFIAATAVLWFLLSFPKSRVVTTATTWRQVEKLLWHEVNQLHGNARFPLGGICLNTELKLDDGRYAIGQSSDPSKSESFSGHHAPRILVVYDEASGVHQDIYEAGEGYMTSAGARMLMIGNPTRPNGEFHAAFNRGRASYRRIHISAFDAPAYTGEQVPEDVAASLLSREWVDERRQRWGEGSPMWKVRVLGDFSDVADTTVISLGGVELAQERELPVDVRRDEIVIACDIARFGSDETVIARRIGDQVRIVDTYVGRPTTETAGRILAEAKKYPLPAVRIVTDDDGVGGGVTDILRERIREQRLEIPVVGFHGGERAYQPKDYPNRRSELWFQMQDVIGDLDLDADDQLAADLTAPEFTYDSHGRRVVEQKDRTKTRIGRSPDRADAVLLTLVKQPAGMSVQKPHERTHRSSSVMSGVMTEQF